jgi:hypothetical protein
MNDTRERARAAWWSALAAAALNTLGMGLELLVTRSVPGVPRWPPIASALVGLGLAGVLIAFRRRAGVALGSVCFVVNATAISAALWVLNPTFAAHPHGWWPFQETKLGCLTVALLAPDLPVGLLSVLIHAGAAVVQWWTFAPEVRAGLALGEPWATIAFAVFGALLLVHRRRQIALERVASRAQAEAATYERLARAFMAVRDLANTPLQTIYVCARLVEMRAPGLRDVASRIDASAESLRRLNEILDEHEAECAARFGRRSDLAFDPLAILREARD